MPRISLSDMVGRDATAGNRLPDTLKLKLGLERLGYYEPDDRRGFTPGPDDGLWYGLESYQRDRGLDVDGVALPDGPTLAALNDDLDRTPAAPLITGTFDEPLSAEAIASNQRTVRALQGFRSVGDLPTFAISALRSGNPSAPSEIADLLARSQADAPEQGQRLHDALGEYLEDDEMMRLNAAAKAKRDGFVQLASNEIEGGGDAGEAMPARSGDVSQQSDQKDRFDQFEENLGAREGGYSDRPKGSDPGGRTYKGLSQDLLDRVRKKNPSLPDDPRNVSDQDRRAILRSQAYDILRIDKWAGIAGLDDAAPKLAEQMFDAGIMSNPMRAGKWLQQALDEHLGTDLKVSQPSGSKAYDGNLGPQTRAAIEQAVKNGKIGEVNNAVAAKREAYVRTLPNFKDNPGWIPRIRSFLRDGYGS